MCGFLRGLPGLSDTTLRNNGGHYPRPYLVMLRWRAPLYTNAFVLNVKCFFQVCPPVGRQAPFHRESIKRRDPPNKGRVPGFRRRSLSPPSTSRARVQTSTLLHDHEPLRFVERPHFHPKEKENRSKDRQALGMLCSTGLNAAYGLPVSWESNDAASSSRIQRTSPCVGLIIEAGMPTSGFPASTILAITAAFCFPVARKSVSRAFTRTGSVSVTRQEFSWGTKHPIATLDTSVRESVPGNSDAT
jgi:hypothetical protein